MPLHRRNRITTNQSRRFAERRRLRTAVILCLVLISAGTWIFSLSELSSLPELTIRGITISGADSDIVSAVQSAAMTAISGKYLGLFSKANVLLYPKSGLLAAAVAASPRIAGVAVTRDGFNALTVEVREKVPSAVICAGLPDFKADGVTIDTGNEDCYLADPTGNIYSPAASTTAMVSDVYFMPDLTSNTGEQALPAIEFGDLQSFYDGAKQSGFSPSAVLVRDNGEYEMYVSSTVVYFDRKRSLSDELSNLVSFWDQKVREFRASGAVFSPEYVDVRYGANIYYR